MGSPLFDRRTSHVVSWAVVLAALCLPAARAAGDAFPFPTFSAPFQVAETLDRPGYEVDPRSLVIGRFDELPRSRMRRFCCSSVCAGPFFETAMPPFGFWCEFM